MSQQLVLDLDVGVIRFRDLRPGDRFRIPDGYHRAGQTATVTSDVKAWVTGRFPDSDERLAGTVGVGYSITWSSSMEGGSTFFPADDEVRIVDRATGARAAAWSQWCGWIANGDWPKGARMPAL